jgi:hypothetical protein
VTFKAAIKLKLLGASFSLLHNNPSCWIWRQVCVFLRCQSWRREWTPHTQNTKKQTNVATRPGTGSRMTLLVTFTPSVRDPSLLLQGLCTQDGLVWIEMATFHLFAWLVGPL